VGHSAPLPGRGDCPSAQSRLRVRAATTFARLHIIPQLPKFLGAFPGLSIEMSADDPWDLIDEDIDVVLRIGQRPDAPLRARKLGESHRVVLGAPAYLARAGEPLVPSDLRTHQSIIYDRPGWGADWIFQRGSAVVPVTIMGAVRVTAAEGLREAVMADLGLAVASEWMFTHELAHGTVKPVLRDWTLPGVDLWAGFPDDRPVSTMACAFIRFVEAQLPR
jgi:DNA-binding transcriptional LysR family regulator